MIKEKFIIEPPSKERSGKGYHCEICDREMVIYQYYFIYRNPDSNIGPNGLTHSYVPGKIDAFCCSEECINMWILSKL